MSANHVALFQLIKLGVERSNLLADPQDPLAPDERLHAKYAFLNMQVMHWKLSYVIGVLSNDALSAHAKRLFVSPSHRRWWELARDFYSLEASGGKARRFVAIVDASYRQMAKSSAAGVSVEETP